SMRHLYRFAAVSAAAALIVFLGVRSHRPVDLVRAPRSSPARLSSEASNPKRSRSPGMASAVPPAEAESDRGPKRPDRPAHRTAPVDVAVRLPSPGGGRSGVRPWHVDARVPASGIPSGAGVRIGPPEPAPGSGRAL